MNRFDRKSKQTQLRNNVEMAVERELRQLEEAEHRERLPGEKEKLRTKWEESAKRVDANKLAEVWNPATENVEKQKSTKGYFPGITIKNGKIIK